jgi:2-polyprenyl-6-methoxyphenol hydroxylase-like FAD-dependent oxidoreductase
VPFHEVRRCSLERARSLRAAIVGAGIGGLTAAIALRQAGVPVTVLERATALREIGAGLLLAANAQKALRELGLSESVGELGTNATMGEIRSWRGTVLATIPIGELEVRVGASSAAVHRADLQRVLMKALGEKPLCLGSECVGFEHYKRGVRVLLANGSEEHADLLIGADGLHSTVRERLFGAEEPRYAGYTAWRAVVELGDDLVPWGTGFESWGRGVRFGCAHIGKGRIYWFAAKNAPEGEKDGEVGSPDGPKRALLRLFRGWHQPIEKLIAATAETAIRRDDLYDREPLERWGEGRVSLLGDAAHPMTPNLGQGASLAIEDAVVLARCLTQGPDGRPDAPKALRRYEELRRERTAAMVRRSRLVGRVGQLENPLLCGLRNLAFMVTPSRLYVRQVEQVVGWEV